MILWIFLTQGIVNCQWRVVSTWINYSRRDLSFGFRDIAIQAGWDIVNFLRFQHVCVAAVHNSPFFVLFTLNTSCSLKCKAWRISSVWDKCIIYFDQTTLHLCQQCGLELEDELNTAMTLCLVVKCYQASEASSASVSEAYWSVLNIADWYQLCRFLSDSPISKFA